MIKTIKTCDVCGVTDVKEGETDPMAALFQRMGMSAGGKITHCSDAELDLCQAHHDEFHQGFDALVEEYLVRVRDIREALLDKYESDRQKVVNLR